jgi:hypothetical protein
MPFLDPNFAEANMIRWGYKPLEPYTKASAKWKCTHIECGEIVYPIYADLNRGRGGCSSCSSIKIDPKIALKKMIKAGFQPFGEYINKRTPWKSKCIKCGKISYPLYSTVNKGSKCKYCQGIAVDPQDAIKLFLSNNLKPLEDYEHSQKAWKSECLICGNIVTPKYASVYSGQGGCAYCAKSGLKYGEPSYLYIIYHYQMNAIKVGITNMEANPDRLNEFKHFGWTVHKKYDFDTGFEAVKIEAAILRWLRKDLNLPVFLSKDQMPRTGGETETISMDAITCNDIRLKADELIKGYRNNP